MALSRSEINDLLRSISLTRPEEATCDECLKMLAEFAEASLDGKSTGDRLAAVEHHLAICTECQEEFETLLAALKDGDGPYGEPAGS